MTETPVCSGCMGNDALVKLVESDGRVGDCEYCGSENVPAAAVEEIGPLIRDMILKAYQVAESHPEIHFEAGDCPYPTFTVEEVFEKENILANPNNWKLRAALLGDDPDEDPTTRILTSVDTKLHFPYDAFGVFEVGHRLAWESFKFQIKHYLRFFDHQSAKYTRLGLLKPIDGILPTFSSILPAGKELFRARVKVLSPGDHSHLVAQIGPPPAKNATLGRMNPRGISYLYLAETPETVLAEVRALVTDRVIIGRGHTIADLRILDLSELKPIVPQSIFDPEFNPSINIVSEFLAEFVADISEPFDPSLSDLEYIPTQAFCEFIRSQDYDGIKYRSSLHAEGINYTLFCGPPHSTYSLPQGGVAYGTQENYQAVVLRPFSEWFEFDEIKQAKCSPHYSYEV